MNHGTGSARSRLAGWAASVAGGAMASVTSGLPGSSPGGASCSRGIAMSRLPAFPPVCRSIPCLPAIPLRDVPWTRVEAVAVGRAVVVLQLVQGLLAPLHALHYLSMGRQRVRCPALRLPQARTQERLRAMKENLLDFNQQRQDGAV